MSEQEIIKSKLKAMYDGWSLTGLNEEEQKEEYNRLLDKLVNSSNVIPDVSNSFLKNKLYELENEIVRLKEFTGLDQL